MVPGTDVKLPTYKRKGPPALKNDREIARRKRLLAVVHIAKKEMCLTSDEYELVLNSFKVASSGDMTFAQLESLVEYMESLGWKKKSKGKQTYWQKKTKWDGVGQRRGMATAAQLARIEANWEEMRWYWEPKEFESQEAGLTAFVKKITGADSLRFVTSDQAKQTIMVMNKIGKKQETGARSQESEGKGEKP